MLLPHDFAAPLCYQLMLLHHLAPTWCWCKRCWCKRSCRLLLLILHCSIVSIVVGVEKHHHVCVLLKRNIKSCSMSPTQITPTAARCSCSSLLLLLTLATAVAIPSCCCSHMLPLPHASVPSCCCPLLLPLPSAAAPTCCRSLVMPPLPIAAAAAAPFGCCVLLMLPLLQPPAAAATPSCFPLLLPLPPADARCCFCYVVGSSGMLLLLLLVLLPLSPARCFGCPS